MLHAFKQLQRRWFAFGSRDRLRSPARRLYRPRVEVLEDRCLPALATHFAVIAPAIAPAGAPVTFSVTALDELNNTATDYPGTVHFTSSDPVADLPADATLSNGTGTFAATLKVAGDQTITASDFLMPQITGTSGPTDVNSATAVQFALITPSSVTSGTPFNFTVSAVDQFGNTDPSYAGAVQLSSNVGGDTLPGSSTLVNGAGTFSATFVTQDQAHTIAATDGANASITGTSIPIAVNANTAPEPTAVTPVSTDRAQFATGAGAGGGPVVNVYGPNQEVIGSFFAYDPRFTGGVNVAVGDVNGDGVLDIITGPGAGGGPTVKVIDGTKLDDVGANGVINNSALLANFFAYDPGFTGGVNVAAGRFLLGGGSSIVTGPGAGGGPTIAVFHVHNGQAVADNIFFAYDPGFSGGVTVAAGDVDGSGIDSIITGPGAGGGPQVRVFGSNGAMRQAFFAYDPAFTAGISVAAGQIGDSGPDRIFTGAGAGGGPQVKAFDGVTANQLASLFAFDPSFTGGVRVAGTNGIGSSSADLLVAAGPGGGPEVRAFDLLTQSAVDSFFAYDPAFGGGVFIGG